MWIWCIDHLTVQLNTNFQQIINIKELFNNLSSGENLIPRQKCFELSWKFV